jgi:hypothetical protein
MTGLKKCIFLEALKFVELLNNYLVGNLKDEFLDLLRYSTFTPKIDFEYASNLYFIEFKNLYEDKGISLDLDDYIHGIKVLNAIVDINRAIDQSIQKTHLISYLLNPNAHLNSMNMNLIDYYVYYFNKQKLEKSMPPGSSSSSISSTNSFVNDEILSRLLTHSEIQDCITMANDQYEQETIAINDLRAFIEKDDMSSAFYTIKNINLMGDTNIIDDNFFLYFHEIKEYIYVSVKFSKTV